MSDELLREIRELQLRVLQHLEITGTHTQVSALCKCGEVVRIPPQWKIDLERQEGRLSCGVNDIWEDEK